MLSMQREDDDLVAARSDMQPAEPVSKWRIFTTNPDLSAILATPDLAVGTRRFALVITDLSGVISLPVVELSTYRYLNGSRDESSRVGPIETARAKFHRFPYGSRGLHVAELVFDSPGIWSVEARVPRADGEVDRIEVEIEVFERTMSVDVGQPAPRSVSRTLADVESIAELTTGSAPDPNLYEISIADAISNGRPTVVVFASPAFCTNAVCGPQVETISNLRLVYSERADFIHVDLFQNPAEIQGDLSIAVASPLLEEWGLTSQEWTFVMDRAGIVRGRFENYAPEQELEVAMLSVLEALE